MKGRIIGTLFALPFAAVGVWMGASIASTLIDAAQMTGWQPVQAELQRAGYRTHSGDDSTTHEAFARYSYEWQGRKYSGDRVALAGGADNIGDYQQELGRRLRDAWTSGETVTVWVNPQRPAESIVDRTIRWGLIGFKSIFLLVFGGVGTGILIAVWRAPAKKDAGAPEYRDAPWLANDRWQSASIRSTSRTAMWGAWLFAAFWNLVSAPLPFLLYDEVMNNRNYPALAGLLFPLVGAGLLVWAIRRTREWRRFGATPVVLDPFPGSIGGHVGGTIDTRLPYSSGNRFLMTLTNINRYESGSGKNSSTREDALWQDELLAHAEPGPDGTRLTFRFDLPDGLAESDADTTGDNCHLWRLNVRAKLDSTDLDRDFEIPVYATATHSQHVPDQKAAAARAEQDALFDSAVREVVRVSLEGVGKRLVYPMGRHAWSNLAGIIIGGTFAAVGAWLIWNEGHWLFGGIFGGVGALVAVSALYLLFRSLEVRIEGNTITSVRRWLGIPLRRRSLSRSAFHRFEKVKGAHMQAGGKHTLFYSVRAIDRSANEILIGEGFRGASGVKAAIRFLSRELGLEESRSRRDRTDYETELVNEF